MIIEMLQMLFRDITNMKGTIVAQVDSSESFQEFCSTGCLGAYENKQNPPKSGLKTKCTVCGKLTEVSPSQTPHQHLPVTPDKLEASDKLTCTLQLTFKTNHFLLRSLFGIHFLNSVGFHILVLVSTCVYLINQKVN